MRQRKISSTTNIFTLSCFSLFNNVEEKLTWRGLLNDAKFCHFSFYPKKSMKAILVALSLSFAVVVAYPASTDADQQRALRASLITKDNFREYQRQKKSETLKLPEPFIVSTELHVGKPSRQSRTYFDNDGTQVIEGQRMPDDPSDVTVHRNGRFINNIFVPTFSKDTQRNESPCM